MSTPNGSVPDRLRVLTAVVEDHPGVLTRVSGMIRRRGFNIQSLSVGPTDEAGRSRLTLTVDAGHAEVDQVQKQLERLIEVIEVVRAPADDRVFIFDTTLRDGEQAPGFALDGDAKRRLAKQLERLGVDVIEAGFPISSPGDFEACQRIAREVRGCSITALARAVRGDIDAVWEAIRDADRPQIHIVLSVSDIHIQRKLGLSRSEVIRRGVEAVKHARSLCDEVEYSPEDAGRADRDYLVETVEAAIGAGATVINIPDTTGYCLPQEFGELIAYVIGNARGSDRAIFSVHCHNDLGLATANTMAGIMNGARRVECTINGIGERAGNTSLEEVVMLLRVRQAALGLETAVDTRQIVPTSHLLTELTGVPVQPNKAIVGANA